MVLHPTLAFLYADPHWPCLHSLSAPVRFPGPKLCCTLQNVKERHVMKAFVLLIMLRT